MDIPSNFKHPKKQGNIKKTHETDTISFNHLGETIQINHQELKEACAKAAKEAYDIGETNDEDAYREEMEETLAKVLQKKQKK